MAKVIFIYGPVASGKLTIAKDLCRLTGFRLFHNHLTVDLLLAVFPFGHPAFVRLRESFWIQTVREAVSAGVSVIFTFAPERTVRPEFPKTLEEAVREAGGETIFVQIRCPETEIERRITMPSRAEHGKLTSLEQYRVLREQGAFDYHCLRSDIVVDSSTLQPPQAAQMIAQQFAVDAKSPNKAPEPTPTAVTSPADAGAAPAAGVAHL